MALKTFPNRQYVPLYDEERRFLRVAALKRDTNAAALSRALLLYGMAQLGTSDLEKVIDAERASLRQRITAGARAGAAARWHWGGGR